MRKRFSSRLTRREKSTRSPSTIEKGIAGTGRLFALIQTEGTEHGAGGMTIVDQDQLYVACLGVFWIFDAQGRQVGLIPLPGEGVTNCAFAGDDFNTLYITTHQGLFYATRFVATSLRPKTGHVI